MKECICEWLKEGKVYGIWNRYNVSMNDEVPSLRTTLERGDDTWLAEMSRYGKCTN